MQENIVKDHNGMQVIDIIHVALMGAIICIATMVINIRTYNGYVHLGDSMVLLSAVLLRRKKAIFSSALGMGLADILLGSPLWAPFTIIIKALMALIVTLVIGEKNRFKLSRQIVGFSLGAIWMVVGYFFAGAIIKHFIEGIPTFTAALGVASLDIPGNIVQGSVGAIISVFLAIALKNVKLFKNQL